MSDDQPSVREGQAYAEMQARLVALLLRFDERGFGRHYRQRQGNAPDPQPLLRPYRDLAALVLLRDELFDDILPRIVRRLSFESPREALREEPPPRGRIDWERTLDASWADMPGALPLLVSTRQRRRDFATPENLLTVAVLLEYRTDLLSVLWDDQLVAQHEVLRHPLQMIVERCDRELAFPQFAGIKSRAEQVLEAGEIDALIHQVAERSIPGGNSAYHELIDWRARLHGLALLQHGAGLPMLTLGADLRRDNYLYQLWIFYELAHLLQAQGCLERVDARQGRMALRFRWGLGADQCTYELRHDQAVPTPPARWGATPLKKYAVPGVRPDFYLWRVDPPHTQVAHNGALFWREPGVIWDAKYYREREQVAAPASPVKRMIADLTLLGEAHGTLLFAFLTGGAAPASATTYRLRPADRDQSLVPDQEVVIQPLCPALDGRAVHATLQALLDSAHARLRQPRQPRCHGVFLDTLSLAERGALLGRDGTTLAPTDLLVCPKPHIGSWRVDLVSRSEHCCRDGRLCHIIGQAGATPPVRPPRTARELLNELDQLFATDDPDTLDEDVIEQTLVRMEGLTRRFAEVTGALQDLERYETKLGDIGLDRTLPLLGPIERESLALAIYLRDQLDDVQANDYSASIIHVARVLERELQRRILLIPGITGADFPHGKPTLGALGGVYRKNPDLWDRIATQLAHVWTGQVDPEDATFVVSIEDLIHEIEILVRARNQAAHTTPISRTRFREVLRTFCQGGPLRVGALNALLLAWPVTVPT